MIKTLSILLSLLLFLTAFVAEAKSLPPILQVIQKEPVDLDDIRDLVHYRWYEKAWEALQKYSSENEEILLLKARALAGMKHYDEALPLFRDLVLHADSPKIRHEALLKEAMALTKLKRYSEALKKYKQLIAQEGKSKKKNLIWRTVKTAIEAKDYTEALKMLGGLSGPEVLWWKGWAHFQMQHYRLALQSWDRIRGSGTVVRVKKRRGRHRVVQKIKSGGALPSQVLYWKAMALKRSGQDKEVTGLLQQVVSKYPVSYYAVLSLAALYPDESDFEAAIKSLWKENTNGKFLGLYPREYATEIEKESKQKGLDPNLAFALIWQESRFRESVISPTGAIGLMQLMPQTALQVANGAKLKNFDLPSIFEPAVNIHLGILYIKFLKELFFDQLPYAIASYNAGEEAVSRWLSLRDHEPVEVFIEEIPFAETQNYTRKVLLAYWMYRWLYEGQTPDRFTQNSTRH